VALVLFALSAAGTHLALAGPSAGPVSPPHPADPSHPVIPVSPHSVPEIDLFAGTSVLMIAVIVGLLLWERRRRTAQR